MTDLVLSAIMMMKMIIKINCNDNKINKLATPQQLWSAKSTVLKLRGI
jgi:hypothetical protein